MAVATSFGVLNYSGALFNKGNTRTPLSSMIGGNAKITDHVEFVTGQEYATVGGAQPEISENASLTAPEVTSVTRAQKTNVTQIFHEAIGVSYGKMSNMGTLSGLNVAGQQANPQTELDFQIAAKLQKVQRDIEYTFVNGVYQRATNDNTANKTRGILNAIESNVIDSKGVFDVWTIADLMKMVYESNAPTEGLVLMMDAASMIKLNQSCADNGLTAIPAAREINGIKVDEIVTPMGVVALRIGEFLPAGTAMLLNVDAMAPVYQPVPGKGNFFVEELAKAGAGSTYQLFGQIGLDHGPEWYHGKITNINSVS